MFGWKLSPDETIDCHTVQEKLQRGERCIVLDVRDEDEFLAGHIPGSLWIPLAELSARVDELAKDVEIIVVCQSGARSALATRFLDEQGFAARNMAGGMKKWMRENLSTERRIS